MHGGDTDARSEVVAVVLAVIFVVLAPAVAGISTAEPFAGHVVTSAGVNHNQTDTPPPITGSSPPTDPDLDGEYEDVDGDGVATALDAAVLATNLPTARDYPSAFDYTGDGEVAYADVFRLFRNTSTGAVDHDFDGDGLPNVFEVETTETAPRDPDSDAAATRTDEGDDGTLDGATDLDGDGLLATTEYLAGTDPLSADTDGDGLGDAVERRRTATDPTERDTDGDGVADGATDSDGDGLTIREEIEAGTAVGRADTDGDGIEDGRETTLGTDSAVADTDGDGLDDGSERRLGTDPLDPDTDDDGTLDGQEMRTTVAHDDETGVRVALTGPGDVAATTTITNATASFGNGTTAVTRVTAGPVVDVSPAGDLQTARVSVPYEAGADRSSLTLARFDADRGWFVPVDSTVHTSNQTVTGTVEHFSMVTVLDTTAINGTVGSGLRTAPDATSGVVARTFENATAPLLGTNPPTKRIAEANVTGGHALLLDGGYGGGVLVDGSLGMNLTRNATVDLLVRANTSAEALFSLGIAPGPDGDAGPSVLATMDGSGTSLSVGEQSATTAVSGTETRWYRLQIASRYEDGTTTVTLRRSPAGEPLGSWDATVTSAAFGAALRATNETRLTLSSVGGPSAVGAYRIRTAATVNVTSADNGSGGANFESTDDLDDLYVQGSNVSVTQEAAFEGNSSLLLTDDSEAGLRGTAAPLDDEQYAGYDLRFAVRTAGNTSPYDQGVRLFRFGVVGSIQTNVYSSKGVVTPRTEGLPKTTAPPAADTWYRVHVQVRNDSDGIDQRVKIWPAASSEPSNWTVAWENVSAGDGRTQYFDADVLGVAYFQGSYYRTYFDDINFSVRRQSAATNESDSISESPFENPGTNVSADSDIDDDGLPNALEKRGIPVSPFVALDIYNPGADDDTMNVTGLENWTHATDLLDGPPLPRIHTSPYAADTDGDGIPDGQELGNVSTVPFTNVTYYTLRSDPTDDNTDDIGIDDAAERAQGTDPLRPENMTVWFTVPTKARGPDDSRPVVDTTGNRSYVLSPVSVHTPKSSRHKAQPTWLQEAYRQTGKDVPNGGTFLLADVPVYASGGRGTDGELPGGATFSITGTGTVVAQGIRAGNVEGATRGNWVDDDTQYAAISEGVTVVSLVVAIPQTPKASFDDSRSAMQYARSWQQGNAASGASVSRDLGHIEMTLANPAGDTDFFRGTDAETPTTTLRTEQSYTVQYFGQSDAIRIYEKGMDRVRSMSINTLTIAIGTPAAGTSEAAISFGALTRSGALFYGGLAAAGANVYRGADTNLTITYGVEQGDPEGPGAIRTIPEFQRQTGSGVREIELGSIRSGTVTTKTRTIGKVEITLHYTHTGAMLGRFN